MFREGIFFPITFDIFQNGSSFFMLPQKESSVLYSTAYLIELM